MFGRHIEVHHGIPIVLKSRDGGAVLCRKVDGFMKRVLLVAYYFSPIAVSGTLRPLGFCRYLEKHGWTPQVLTTEVESVYPPQQIDDSLLEKVPSTVRVIRVGHANPARKVVQIRNALRKILSWVWRQNGETPDEDYVSDASKPEMPKGWMARMKDRLGAWVFQFPDPQRFWLRPAVRLMSKRLRTEYPDVVMATGSPWTGLLVGRDLAKKFGVPFIADFRDPWHENPYKPTFSPGLTKKAKKLERSVLLSASKVIANTPELCEQFQKTYPDLVGKFVTIANGFDVNDQPKVQAEPNTRWFSDQEQVRDFGLELCHFGTVYGTRNPLFLLKALKELCEENEISSKSIRLRFVGKWGIKDDYCEYVAQHMETKGLLVRTPQVSHHQCLEQMAKADILLILQPGSRLQIPGKLYEYLAFQKPILVVGGEGATSSLVQRYTLGHCCSNDVLSLKGILSSLASRPDFILPPSEGDIEQFRYASLTHKLVEVLNAVST